MFIKIENSVVIQVQPYKEHGFIETEESVVCGMVVNDDGSFTNPNPPAKTAYQIRDEAFTTLVHDFGDGRVIQCRPQPFSDESNIRNAIEQMGRLNQLRIFKPLLNPAKIKLPKSGAISPLRWEARYV